ncbi:AMP-binding protein [Oscillatoria sp. CS-180]|uniref:AMP-binding protein n=1 Tax=Oscillatoria sp. CS-180 TaxID=3021720 RepID=UPI00232E26B3|nr:AMP-binding protein [Oscillatoria sp. CS-180]MDB9527354.1 AMP-binding protein [Oscillatoria sp. CS-180]
MTATALLQQRLGALWLLGTDSARFWPYLQEFQAEFEVKSPNDVLLIDAEPVRFLAAFLAACQHPCRLWLADPRWGQREWQQVYEQCPELVADQSYIVGDSQIINTIARTSETASPYPAETLTTTETQILIPTGGSSGNIRFAVHTWQTLMASVQGFRQHFQSDVVNAYCVLPLFHVSGLMQAMRCWVSGGQLVVQSFPMLLKEGPIETSLPSGFLSLVPTQLQRLLKHDRDFTSWLRQFTAVLLGGAPTWPTLLQEARACQLPLAPTYGMTETASQVATLLPQQFLAGRAGSGCALPHAQITIVDQAGQSLAAGKSGRIAIQATSLAKGYWQKPFNSPFLTGDLGYWDDLGILHVMGREKGLIMTGGEKVLPEEVESAILKTGLVKDVAVVGVPDEDWGEIVVAVVVPEIWGWSSDRLAQTLKSHLSPYKLPKHWFTQSSLPRTAQGKVNRADIRDWIVATLTRIAEATESVPPSTVAADE